MQVSLPADGPVRRRPVQQRSQERVERILDACAVLLDETGHGGLTTKEVALRAGVPIGTLYQFFPNIQGLPGALAHRNLEQYIGSPAAPSPSGPRISAPWWTSRWRSTSPCAGSS